MLEYEREPEYETVPKYKFWSPPRKYQIPEAPPGHIYIPLHQGYLKARYTPKPYNSYPMLSDSIPENDFNKVIDSANFIIKTPYFKLTFIRLVTLLIMINSLYRIIISIVYQDFVNIVIYSIILCYSPFLMRYGCGQYLSRMGKYVKVLNKGLMYQNGVRLSGSNVVAEAGKMCLWLDFYMRRYEPPQESEGLRAVIVPPGARINV